MSDILQKDFKIEKIVKAGTRDGRRMYFIKWKDYPDSENTWEYADDLRHDGHGDELDAFEKRRADKKSRSKAKKKAPQKKEALNLEVVSKKRKRQRLTPPPKKRRKGDNSSLAKAVTATLGFVGSVVRGAGNIIGAVVGSNEKQADPPTPKSKSDSDDDILRRIQSRRKKKLKF